MKSVGFYEYFTVASVGSRRALVFAKTSRRVLDALYDFAKGSQAARERLAMARMDCMDFAKPVAHVGDSMARVLREPQKP